jgi:hypothetical protein
MRKSILIILGLLNLTACSPTVDLSEYEAATQRYCEPCGGVRTAFINYHGQIVTCKDGHQLEQTWKSVPKVLLIKSCK